MLSTTLIVILAVLPLLQASPSGARLRRHADANDAPVDDLSFVQLHTYMKHGVRMLSADADFYTDRPPDDCCWNIWFVIDSRGDDGPDYVVHASFDGASGGIWNADLERPNGTVLPRAVRVTSACNDCAREFPLFLRFRAIRATRAVHWYVTTIADRAPDTGWFTH